MSVMLLPAVHLNTILSWAVAQACSDKWADTLFLSGRRLHWPSQTQEIGQILADCNARAFGERYRESVSAADYLYKEVPRAELLQTGAIATLVDSLEYQCDDLADWEASDAARVLKTVRQMLIKTLPGNHKKAKWTIDNASDVAAMTRYA